MSQINPMYFIADKVDGFTEEKEGKKYLNFNKYLNT